MGRAAGAASVPPLNSLPHRQGVRGVTAEGGGRRGSPLRPRSKPRAATPAAKRPGPCGCPSLDALLSVCRNASQTSHFLGKRRALRLILKRTQHKPTVLHQVLTGHPPAATPWTAGASRSWLGWSCHSLRSCEPEMMRHPAPAAASKAAGACCSGHVLTGTLSRATTSSLARRGVRHHRE